jgi:hypothetical protein
MDGMVPTVGEGKGGGAWGRSAALAGLQVGRLAVSGRMVGRYGDSSFHL